MDDSDVAKVSELLKRSKIDANPADFKRVASAKTLYHWSPDSKQVY